MISVVGWSVVNSCCVVASEFFDVAIGSVVVAAEDDLLVKVDVAEPVVSDVIAEDGLDENCVEASEVSAIVVKTKQYIYKS